MKANPALDITPYDYNNAENAIKKGKVARLTFKQVRPNHLTVVKINIIKDL